jgi:hypothetical protein
MTNPINDSFNDGVLARARVVVGQIQVATAPRVAELRAGVSFQPTLRPRIVCAWCQVEMSPGDPGGITSHGICPKCAEAERAKLRARR